MILLDTNVLIYAFDPSSPHRQWAEKTIIDAVGGEGAAVNAASLAEICVGDEDPPTSDRGRFETYFPSVSLKTPR
jgi:predicted nucleic acid-binding protein